MKLHILSDLHLGFQALEAPDTDADVVVLAGDIAGPQEAVAWALGLRKPVVYVPGNHEFYGSSLADTTHELRRLCHGTPVHVLDDNALVLDGVRFLGSTLWTDFRILGEGERQLQAMAEAQRFMHDFRRIRIGVPPADAILQPQDTADLFAIHARWLDAQLSTPHPGTTVVVTHHAPSALSIHPRFSGSALNASFVSNAEHLLGGQRACLWIHGHTHDSFDYRLHGTRVVCNPRGYAKNGVPENPHFNPLMTIEI